MISKGIAGFNAGLVKSVGNSYTPTEWITGDVITADKLNNIEAGVENNENNINSIKTCYVDISLDWSSSSPVASVDKTYDELKGAYDSGAVLVSDYYTTFFIDSQSNLRTEIIMYTSSQSTITALQIVGVIVKPDNTVQTTYVHKSL